MSSDSLQTHEVGTSVLLTRLGEAIRRRRRARGWKLRHIVEASGLALGYVSQIELGRSSPSLAVLARVAAALDCSMATLIREAETEPESSDYAEQGVG